MGEFCFIPKYWEWTEDVLFHFDKALTSAGIADAVHASLFTYDCNKDVMRAFCEAWCPDTNTLHVAAGEVSISLWDLHKLGGLPMHEKNFYDEVIPSAAELTRYNNEGKFLPKTCEYLFAAFHHLRKSTEDNVSIEDWINFWFRGEQRYSKPPARKLKKIGRAHV